MKEYIFVNFKTGEIIVVESINENEALKQAKKTFGEKHMANFEGSFNDLKAVKNEAKQRKQTL